MSTPDSMPAEPLRPADAGELMDTIQGICNESMLERAEILGVLEAVKMAMFMSWQRDAE